MWLSSLSAAERHALMRLAHNVVVSDGLLDPNEEGMLNEFRLEMELTQSGEFEYLELDGIETVFVSRQARIIVLLNLLKLSYADGAFEVEEECLLKEVSRAFSVSDEEFMLLDNWTRRLNALEVEARDLMDLPG
jgi:tellurite resistance protein